MTDPVCGMGVEEHAAAKAEYEGDTFYFCSVHCHSVFERTPDVYLPAKRRASERQHRTVMGPSDSKA